VIFDNFQVCGRSDLAYLKLLSQHLHKQPEENHEYIVTYRPIARQRLGKHILAQAEGRNNWISIARQRISKQAFSTIERLFSVWSVQSSYKEAFGNIEQYRTVAE
jgi:hypothetical protein